jgi:hypothetical protein
MGAQVEARVLGIDPCPQIATGKGRIITGTFAHKQGQVWELRLQGHSQIFGVTATHPFWSADRNDWVPAGELRIGERLLAADGSTPKVESFVLRDEPEPVYNLEVEGDHCYRVGSLGLLVHNASDPCSQTATPVTLNNPQYVYRKIPVNENRESGPPDWGEQKVIKSVRFLLKDSSVIASFSGGTKPDDDAQEWIKEVVGMDCDDPGHALGKQFGGPGTIDNVYPQHCYANQTWQRTRENKVKAVVEKPGTPSMPAACRVCVFISLDYDPAAKFYYRARPIAVNYEVWVDGVEWDKTGKRIDNPTCAKLKTPCV